MKEKPLTDENPPDSAWDENDPRWVDFIMKFGSPSIDFPEGERNRKPLRIQFRELLERLNND